MALTTPFAQNGDKKEIPQNTSDGSVSFNNGFGSFYALPPEEGGLFIDRAQFNQLMYDTTSQVLENKTAIATQANRINEVNTTLTQSINTKANQATTYNKTEVNNLLNAKANSNAVVALSGNQTIAGVKTFSSVPISATNPTVNNQVANKAYVDTVGNTAVKLTGNQTIAGTKTFSSPVVVPNATANTHAVNLAQLNTKANQATTYTKTEVDTRVNAKIDSTKATKLLTENLVKTVGGRGADFATLRQALEWASQYSYSGGRFTITLRCNAGMGSPGTRLPIGEALIVIDGQNNTFNCVNSYYFAASMNQTEINGGIFNSNITIKNFIFTYNNVTTSDVYGCLFQLSGINATFDNITINISNSNIGNNLIVFQRANCYITNLKINCSGYTNINNVIRGVSSTVTCATPRLNLSNLTGQITALFLLSNSKALTNSTSNIPLPADKIQAQIAVYDGSIVSCNNEYNNAKLSQVPNTLTQNGIIFKR